jgi:hypothetical protein
MARPTWDPYYPVTAYAMARVGEPESEIMKALGASTQQWAAWRRSHPELVEALRAGAKHTTARKQGQALVEALSPEAQATWANIQAWRDLPDGPLKTEAMLAEGGLALRQEVFLYALVSSGYRINQALRCTNTTPREYQGWVADPQFQQLVRELEWTRDNFYEECFMDLCRSGEPSAVTHAVKSRLAHRGYGVKVEAQVEVQQAPGLVDIAALDLDPDTLEKVWAAVKAQGVQVVPKTG